MVRDFAHFFTLSESSSAPKIGTSLTFLLQAKVAQLVEHDLAKVGVAGSNPVFRSIFGSDLESEPLRGPGGGIGRHVGLKIQ